jgi:ParB-like chromosome segregation protein Spo0J
MKEIKLEIIRIDGGTQYRDQINHDVVRDYTASMRNMDVFPPLQTVFDGSTHWLVDGFHRYFAYMAAGAKLAPVEYKPGTQREAQVLAMGVNGNHGLQRNNATKRRVVEAALIHEDTKDLSNLQIAKLCKVSDTFVAAVRNPEAKAKQAEKIERHFEKKLAEKAESGLTEPDAKLTTPEDDFAPDAEELKANDMALAADIEAMHRFLEADDKMAQQHAEIEKLNFLNAQLQLRIDALMREKNELVKECKKLQKQVDKAKK